MADLAIVVLGATVTADGFLNAVIFYLKRKNWTRSGPWWFQWGRIARGIIGLAIMGLGVSL